MIPQMTDAYVGLDGLGQVGEINFDSVNNMINQGITTASKIVPLFQKAPRVAPAPQVIRTPARPAPAAAAVAPGRTPPAAKTDWGKILPWAIGGGGLLFLAMSMRGGK